MSYENSQQKNNKHQNIISLGSSLDLELTLSLEEKQYESINIEYKEISKIDDLKQFNSYQSPFKLQKLISLMELKTNNFLFNSLLFINQSSKKKLPIKYIIPFSPKFAKEFNFIYDIIKSITETNNIYIEDSNLLDIKPNIIFTLKLINNDITVEEKSFLITNENHYNNPILDKNKKNENEAQYNGDLFEGLNLNYDCDYFYSTINELFNCKKNSENEIYEFLQKLINKYQNVKICINYDENYLLNNDFLKNIIEFTNIFIFEKKEIIKFYENNNDGNDDVKMNNKIENNKKSLVKFFINKIQITKNQIIKIGIFINNMEEIYLIQQDPKSNLILFQSEEKINLIPININEENLKKNNELITSKYNLIKSAYIGTFLNRLIRQETFEMCLKTALKCSIKYLEIL